MFLLIHVYVQLKLNPISFILIVKQLVSVYSIMVQSYLMHFYIKDYVFIYKYIIGKYFIFSIAAMKRDLFED